MQPAVTRADLAERVAAILDGAGGLAEKLTQVAAAAAEAFEVERAWVAVVEGEVLRTVGGVAMVLADPRHPPQSIQTGVVGRAVRTRSTQRVDDVYTDVDYCAAVALTRSELATPILDPDDGRAIGAINLEANRLAAFGPAEAAIAERVAALLAPHLRARSGHEE